MSKKDTKKICSFLSETFDTLKGIFSKYSNGIFNSLGTLIKGISFVVAFAILIIFILVAFLMLSSDMNFMGLAICIVLVGIIVAAIFMFLIFGLGHLITQNDEILKLLKEKQE